MPQRPRRALAGVLLAGALGLTACTPAPGPDPALTALAEEALSATRSARLGLAQSADGATLAPTVAVLWQDMADDLADTARDLELARADRAEDAGYRSAALDATRDAIGGIRAAQSGDDEAAAAELDRAAAVLAGLEGTG